MSTNRKTQTGRKKLMDFSTIEKFHPYKTFLFFGLVGSTILFLSVSFLYFLTISRGEVPENFRLPKAFSVSTILMLFSSYSISGIMKSFRNDSSKGLKNGLLITLGLSLLFCISQSIGWMQLYNEGFMPDSHVSVTYLYLISGIHFAHVVGGIIYLVYLTGIVFSRSGDFVKSLLFFSDNHQMTKFQLAGAYWHFVDFLWVGLFLMFLFTF